MKRVAEVFGEPIADGGQETFVYNVISRFGKDDFAIDLLTPYYSTDVPLSRLVRRRGGEVWSADLEFAPGGLRTNIYKPLLRRLSDQKYDIAHIHSGSVSALAILARAASRAGIPKVIVHAHSTGVAKDFKYRLARLLSDPIMARSATDYLACSREAGAWKFPRKAAETRMVVVNNGVPLEVYRFDSKKRVQLRNELNIPRDSHVLGQVGRFDENKNQLFTVSLFQQLKTRQGDAKLLFVGDGALRSSVEKGALEAGIADDVVFTGSVCNVQDYYQAMDVLVMPSHYEGLPMVPLEAQACGIPVLASDAVSREINVSGHVEFLPLDAGAIKWSETVSRLFRLSRYDATDAFVDARFDAGSTSDMVKKIYLAPVTR